MREPYSTPPNIVDENLFRTPQLPEDSLGMAHISYTEIFNDSILLQHISNALAQNLDVRIAGQNILVAEAYLKQARAAYQPTLNLATNYTFVTQSLNTQFGRIIGERRYIHQFDITSQISWEADIWGKLKAQEQAQLAQFLSTFAGHQTVKADLVTSLASLYFQLLALDEQKRILEETIDIRTQNVETTQLLKDAGILTEVAVQQSDALVYNAKAMLVEVEGRIFTLENAFCVLLAIPSQPVSRTTLNEQTVNISLETGYPLELLSNRPDIIQAENELRQAYALTTVARANFYPMFRINGTIALQSIELDDLLSINSFFANVASGFLQPILARRQIRSEYEASLARQEMALLNFRKSILNAGREVSDAMKIYQLQDEFIALKLQELEAYERSVEYSQELLNYGMANYLEVLNANVSMLSAELSVSNARLARLQAAVDLYRALGGGWR